MPSILPVYARVGKPFSVIDASCKSLWKNALFAYKQLVRVLGEMETGLSFRMSLFAGRMV